MSDIFPFSFHQLTVSTQ